jgi:hypothetical protein
MSKSVKWKWVGIILLPFAAIITLYQIAFCIWMCAHPLYVSTEWRVRLLIRLVSFVAIGLGWIYCLRLDGRSNRT